MSRTSASVADFEIVLLQSTNKMQFLTLDAESNKNIKDIEILLKRNWNFPKHIFIKNIERNI
jgi:hypothetical protein